MFLIIKDSDKPNANGQTAYYATYLEFDPLEEWPEDILVVIDLTYNLYLDSSMDANQPWTEIESLTDDKKI